MKTKYRVSDGIEWVNGAKVPTDRTVELSEAEAAYDLQMGRIEAVTQAAPAKPATKAE